MVTRKPDSVQRLRELLTEDDKLQEQFEQLRHQDISRRSKAVQAKLASLEEQEINKLKLSREK